MEPGITGNVPPLLAVTGWSGSGKTTLIENLLPRLEAVGLLVGVWKHDAHRLEIETPGKDTDRFFQAGASLVLGEDSGQLIVRCPKRPRDPFPVCDLIGTAPVDLILVEGHKKSPFPKIWLEHPDPNNPKPDDLENCLATFRRTPDLIEDVFSFVQEWLFSAWRSRSLQTAILVGGESKRMGSPKTLMEIRGENLLESLCARLANVAGTCPVLVGKAPLPANLEEECLILPDVEQGKGPLAGLLSLLRWNPTATWMVLACDLAGMNQDFLDWLRKNRRPGVWAVVPRLSRSSHFEPLAAIYEPQIRPFVEQCWREGRRSLHSLFDRISRIATPVVPKDLRHCLVNLNTPEDRTRFLEQQDPLSERDPLK